jgi:phospholipase C
MKYLSRVFFASLTLAAIFFLSGCQGLVAGGGPVTPPVTPPPVTPPPPPPPAAKPSTVTITEDGSGSGGVTSSPAGIDCGSTCTANFADGDITLTAAPGASFVFTGWSGACTGTDLTCVIPAGSTATANVTFTATLQSINHIIFTFQENRSFDHYFGNLKEYRQNQGLDTDVDDRPHGATNPAYDTTQDDVQSFHLITKCVENPSPSWNESHVDFNRGNPVSGTFKGDGFVRTAAHDAINTGMADITGQRVMGYYVDDDLPFYYFMATNFAMSDRWFAPMMSRTQPNRLYMVAATSDGHVYPPAFGTKVNRKTIFELLQNAGISWRVYVPKGNPTLIEGSEMVMFPFSNQHSGNFVLASQFKDDVANGTLAQVSFIDAGSFSGLDEHPADDPTMPGGSIQQGSFYIQDEYITPFLNSPSWKDSVFILSWDEHGGFYDHVAPQPAVAPDNVAANDFMPGDICSVVDGPTCGFKHTGYRVPMMVISPFSKKNYVSHAVADHTAILKFIETRFGLPNLTERDKAQIDMSTEFFDFVNAPWATPPASVPIQPKVGPCVLTLP